MSTCLPLSLQVPEKLTGFMANIALPSSVCDEATAALLQKRLMDQHHMSIVYASVPNRNYVTSNGSDDSANNGAAVVATAADIFFVRLSAQVYLEMKDFELFADVVLDIVKDIKAN